jgi:hypothetical protein
MKSIKLDYDEIGSVCLVDKEAFDRFWSELKKFGIAVKTTRPTKHAPDAPKRGAKNKSSKSKVKSGPTRW